MTVIALNYIFTPSLDGLAYTHFCCGFMVIEGTSSPLWTWLCDFSQWDVSKHDISRGLKSDSEVWCACYCCCNVSESSMFFVGAASSSQTQHERMWSRSDPICNLLPNLEGISINIYFNCHSLCNLKITMLYLCSHIIILTCRLLIIWLRMILFLIN